MGQGGSEKDGQSFVMVGKVTLIEKTSFPLHCRAFVLRHLAHRGMSQEKASQSANGSDDDGDHEKNSGTVRDSRKEKSLGILSLRFVQLFLVAEDNFVALEQVRACPFFDMLVRLPKSTCGSIVTISIDLLWREASRCSCPTPCDACVLNR